MDHQKRSDHGLDLSPARLLIPFSCAMALVGAAFGQPPDCTLQTRNVLRFENCGFDSGVGGWDALVGVNARRNRDQGNPSIGSYQLESVVDEDGDRETTLVSPCVPIARSSTYQVEAQFKIVDPSDAVTCGFFVAGYSDSRCAGAPNGMDSAEVRVSGAAWASLADTYASRAVDSSMEIYTFCYEDASGPVFTMLMDNFIAEGPVSRSPIFSDGFESGDTSAWSRTVR